MADERSPGRSTRAASDRPRARKGASAGKASGSRAKATASPPPSRRARAAAPSCCSPSPIGDLFVASETDRLRACLVHAPGREIDRLIPANYRWHLYDDLLHLDRARREHLRLCDLLGRFGATVHELTDLLAGVYERMSSTDRGRFLERVHDVSPGAPLYVLRELAAERDPMVVARALIEGVEASNSFTAEVEDALYHLQPMANLIFMQDVAVVLLDRVVQGYMSQLVRMPEEIVVETVVRQSHVFGPRGTGEFWIDPEFRERHRMHRTAREYVQIDAARLHVRLGEVEIPGRPGHGEPAKLSGDRVHVELENAFTTEGRHFILEGGNILALRRKDGATVVLLGHNARTSAEAIDELAYRLLREDGRNHRAHIGAVIVVDLPDTGPDAPHLDTRLLVLGDHEIAADRSLVQAAAGMPARFFLFRPEDGKTPGAREGGALRLTPKVSLTRCAGFEEALARAGLDVKLRWIPAATPWETGSPEDGAAWIRVQQSIWAHALNLLTVGPGVLVGLDRHATFYAEQLGAVCVDAEKEIFAGPLADLRCCALLDALRARGGGSPVVVTLRGDEISRARGGARSLVMPLAREPRKAGSR
ncbi:MAG: arginine deiminase family protein [Minicystis sp.]